MIRLTRKRKTGGIEFIALFLVLITAVYFVGGFPKVKISPSSQSALINTANPAQYCCDSGSGADCKVQKGTGQIFTLNLNGQEYGLLKSNITLQEGISHLKDSGQKFNNNPIILNSSDGFKRYDGYGYIECINGNQDSIFKSKPLPETPLSDYGKYCLAIPNDEIVYVCKKNCFSTACPKYNAYGKEINYSVLSGISCYGDYDSVYDVYFRVSDETNPGIPDVIKNCTIDTPGAPLPTGNVTQKIVFKDNATISQNIQLKTFGVEQTVSIPSGTTAFLSPFCKPAVYLYPTAKTQINVKIAPKGPVTLTIPKLPASGWDVTAYPSGKIESPDGVFPYLYYEAQIPDNLLTKDKNGYVVEYKNLQNLFQTLLPKLGLNEKEKTEFSDYWLKALPASPFYFVGVVSTQTLDSVSPLNISPKPQTIIRVGLYFEPLTEKISVSQPRFSDTTRKGFTVVEWGGLFKKEKNSNFTCIM